MTKQEIRELKTRYNEAIYTLDFLYDQATHNREISHKDLELVYNFLLKERQNPIPVAPDDIKQQP